MEPNYYDKGTVLQDSAGNQRIADGSTGFKNDWRVITPASLDPVSPLKLPTTPTDTTSSAIGGSTDQMIANYLRSQESAAQNAKNTAQTAVEDTLKKVLDIQTSQSAEEAKAGIPELSKLSNDTFTALQASKRSQERELLDLDKNAGLYSAQAQQAKRNEVNRKYAFEQADLSIAYDVANRNFTNAQATIDKKIALQLAPLQTILQYQQSALSDNKADWSKKEQNQLQFIIDQNKTKLEDTRTKVQNAYEAWKLAAQNGGLTSEASTNMLKLINEGKFQEAQNIAAPYLGERTITDIGGSKALVDKQGNIVKWLGGGAGGGVTISTNNDYTDFLTGRTPEQATAFMKIPADRRDSVMQLVNGDALLTDIVKSRGANTQAQINQIINEARSVDPNFSINTNKVRYEFMKKWTSSDSVTGKNRNAINTALGHLADLKTTADSLDSGSLRKLNSLKNILSTETGDPKVLQLRADITALAGELASVYKGNGGAGTESEIKNWENIIAADFSKQQFAGVSNEVAKLLSSKISATRYQYKQTMGKEYGQSVIDPDKLQALIDAGIDPNVITKENVPGAENKPYTPSTPQSFLNSPIPTGNGGSVEPYNPTFWNNALTNIK